MNPEISKRRYRRKKILAIVNLYHSSLESPSGTGCLVDMSLGGLCIEARAEFKNQDIVITNIPLSGGRKILIEGEVQWAHPMPLKTFRYGIKFRNLTGGMKLKLFFMKPFIRKMNKDLLGKNVQD